MRLPIRETPSLGGPAPLVVSISTTILNSIFKNVLISCSALSFDTAIDMLGSCHKRQKPQAPTPQAPIRNC